MFGRQRLAFYEDRQEHYGGALLLFKRNLSVAAPNSKTHRQPNWYMRLKVAGHKGYITRSTKLAKYEEAFVFAQAEFLRLQQAARLGHSLDEYTFEQHWNDWYERNLRNGTWKEERALWHKMYFNRYFKDYFSDSTNVSMLLNDITPQFAHGYWDWRKAYWTTERAAKLRNYNPKRRSSKTRGTANAKTTPALKTLLMEQSALNTIFYDAFEKGRMQQVFKLRVGEARQMKWSDVKLDEEVDGEDERIAEVRVSKATKKGQARFVQTQPGANNALRAWRERTLYAERSDWVWFGQKRGADGKAQQMGDLNKIFQQYLRAIDFDGRQDGLLYDRDGDRRSLYSLRHTYATLRLEKGDVAFTIWH